jgi:O-antigen/teichoic acid export membrane protein
VTIAGGVLNVIGMYVLIKYVGIGVFAVAWTTVVVMCVINFVTNPLYMAHVLKLPYSTFYPDIFRNVLSCAVLTAFYCGLAALYTPQSWIMLILCVIAYALAGVPLHFAIACDKKQKRLLLQAVKNMIKR